MVCFNHKDTNAVGICKYCGKGVCSRCVLDTGVGLTCSDSEVCETKVRDYHDYTERVMKIYSKSKSSSLMIGLSTVACLAFLYAGITNPFNSKELAIIYIILGLISGFSAYRAASLMER